MHGRMSRLRRSLSRSVLQLQAIQSLSRSSGHLPDPLEPTTMKAAEGHDLVDKFACPSTFPQLRQYVQSNCENLREVIDIFEEKVALDSNYSKSLHKLAARLHKITQKAESDIDRGWTSAAEQFDMQATIHSNLSSALSDDIVQPLRAVQFNQERSIRSTGIFMDKQLSRLKKKKADMMRAKRLAYSSAKDLEKLDQTIDGERTNVNKFNSRRKKLEETARKNEDTYLFESIDLEKLREQTEKMLHGAVGTLESVERERLAHSQTALGRLQRKIEQLGPAMQQMFSRQTHNLDLAVHSPPSSSLSSLLPSQSPANHVTLIDVFAENFAEVMKAERRKESLRRLVKMIEDEIQRMYSVARAEDVRSSQISLVEYMEYLHYKMKESLSSLEGIPYNTNHRLAKFAHRFKDKQGLPHSVLSLPLTEGSDPMALPGLPSPSLPPSSPSIAPPSPSFAPSLPPSSPCEDYEEYEKISDEGFYNAPSTSRQSTLIDDPGSEEHQMVCKVIYDFIPSSDQELEIRAGESILVQSRLSNDWLFGRVLSPLGRPSSDKTGRFPATYVSLREASIML